MSSEGNNITNSVVLKGRTTPPPSFEGVDLPPPKFSTPDHPSLRLLEARRTEKGEAPPLPPYQHRDPHILRHSYSLEYGEVSITCLHIHSLELGAARRRSRSLVHTRRLPRSAAAERDHCVKRKLAIVYCK